MALITNVVTVMALITNVATVILVVIATVSLCMVVALITNVVTVVVVVHAPLLFWINTTRYILDTCMIYSAFLTEPSPTFCLA